MIKFQFDLSGFFSLRLQLTPLDNKELEDSLFFPVATRIISAAMNKQLIMLGNNATNPLTITICFLSPSIKKRPK